jgi:hypothetical protein
VISSPQRPLPDNTTDKHPSKQYIYCSKTLGLADFNRLLILGNNVKARGRIWMSAVAQYMENLQECLFSYNCNNSNVSFTFMMLAIFSM